MDYTNSIKDYIALEIETLKKLNVEDINKAMNLMDDTRKAGGTIFVSEYLYKKGEPKFKLLCLNDNVATMMAIANDIGFEEVFRFQLEGVIKEGDIVMAISGSGNSKNVLNAVEYAKSCGNKIIGITGYDGGKLKEMSDVSLCADVMSMQVTEDIHMIYDHLIMSIFYKTLAGKDHLRV